MHHKRHAAHRPQAWAGYNKSEWHQAAAAGCGQAFRYGGAWPFFVALRRLDKKIERMERHGI